MRLIVLVLLAVMAVSCTSEKRTTYQVKGVIKEITPDRKQAKIDHENIPGYMEAMTMMFDVKDPKELNGLQRNDQVTFTMIVTAKDGWIEQVKKIGTVVETNKYQVKGVIKEISPDRKQAKIDHENIPGYMEAMTMMFDVKDPKELTGLQPNDQVTFSMIVTENDGWIEKVKKIGVVVETNTPPPFRVVREVEPLKVGDVMPEYKFTNELGKVVSLSEFRGKALAITFLFTRCPFPTFCPRMASNLKEASKLLSEKSDAPKNWHLLAITIDPDFDTPAVLKEYAARYEYDPARWSFLTGENIDITAIAEQFGLLYWRPDPKQVAGISHNLRTVVIDANGRVQKILPENKWEAPELVEELIKAARVAPAPATAAGSGE